MGHSSLVWSHCCLVVGHTWLTHSWPQSLCHLTSHRLHLTTHLATHLSSHLPHLTWHLTTHLGRVASWAGRPLWWTLEKQIDFLSGQKNAQKITEIFLHVYMYDINFKTYIIHDHGIVIQ